METKIKSRNENILEIEGSLFYKILEALPPHLKQDSNKPLNELYEVGIHKPTGSIYVCNKGASLLTKTPVSQKDYITYHIGFGIFMPNHGAEIVNLGVVGNIERSNSVIIRPESACAPSFLFGSQRCNCYDQWILARELAGHYNEFEVPDLKGMELEDCIKEQFEINENGIPVSKKSSQTFLLMHMDSQNGMGSGAIEGRYNPDLTLTAFLRHRGEYSAEQIFSTSMAGGFTSLGISPDPRKLNESAGYKTPVVVLDYLGIKKPIIALTNNREKVKVLKEAGYNVDRLDFFARVNHSCYLETEDRRNEFGHEIPQGLETNIEQEFSRLNQELDQRIK